MLYAGLESNQLTKLYLDIEGKDDQPVDPPPLGPPA